MKDTLIKGIRKGALIGAAFGLVLVLLMGIERLAGVYIAVPSFLGIGPAVLGTMLFRGRPPSVEAFLGMFPIFYGMVGLVFGFVWALRERPKRHAPGACPHCGYDLRGSPERCPECGRASRSTE